MHGRNAGDLVFGPGIGGDDRLSVNATLKYMPQRGGPIPGTAGAKGRGASSQSRRVG